MDLRELMKSAGLDAAAKTEKFQKVKRPPPWLASNESENAPEIDQEKDECGTKKNHSGIKPENHSGMILKTDPENSSDSNSLEYECGTNDQKHSGMKKNHSGINHENSPNELDECGTKKNHSGIKQQKHSGMKKNHSGMISKNAGRKKLEKADDKIRQLRKVKGNELVVFQWLLNQVISPKTRETWPVRLRQIHDESGIPYDCVRKAIQQSLAKSLVERIEVKHGCAGFVRYRFSPEAYEFFIGMRGECGTKKNHSGIKQQKHSGMISPLSSSSSLLGILNPQSPTTTTTESAFSTDGSWVHRLDIPPLVAAHITTSHLSQLARRGWTEEQAGMVQLSLDNFALCFEFGLDKDWRRPPANVFMGVLLKGEMWEAPEGFEFDNRRAMKAIERDQARLENAILEIARFKLLEKEKMERPSDSPIDNIPF